MARCFSRMSVPFLILMLGISTATTAAAPIVFAGRNVDLAIARISDRTVRITLTPTPAPPDAPNLNDSDVLAPQPWPEPALRVAELDGPRDVELGTQRVRITPSPLAIELATATGDRVQRLDFDGKDAVVTFPLGEGPLFGLGEGAQQFDRRGALYPMQPSWGAWNRPVLGSVVPSPYLISTTGWALFAHHPEGQFDLRGDTGRFLPI